MLSPVSALGSRGSVMAPQVPPDLRGYYPLSLRFYPWAGGWVVNLSHLISCPSSTDMVWPLQFLSSRNWFWFTSSFFSTLEHLITDKSFRLGFYRQNTQLLEVSVELFSSGKPSLSQSKLLHSGNSLAMHVKSCILKL